MVHIASQMERIDTTWFINHCWLVPCNGWNGANSKASIRGTIKTLLVRYFLLASWQIFNDVSSGLLCKKKKKKKKATCCTTFLIIPFVSSFRFDWLWKCPHLPGLRFQHSPAFPSYKLMAQNDRAHECRRTFTHTSTHKHCFQILYKLWSSALKRGFLYV